MHFWDSFSIFGGISVLEDAVEEEDDEEVEEEVELELEDCWMDK